MTWSVGIKRFFCVWKPKKSLHSEMSCKPTLLLSFCFVQRKGAGNRSAVTWSSESSLLKNVAFNFMDYSSASGNKGTWRERHRVFKLKYQVFIVRKLAGITAHRICIIENQIGTRAYLFFSHTSKSFASDEAIPKSLRVLFIFLVPL